MIEWIQNISMLISVVGVLIAIGSQILPTKPYQVLAMVIGLMIALFGVYLSGGKSERIKWEAKIAKIEAEEAKLDSLRKDITTEVAILSSKKREQIKEKSIIKNVYHYVTKEDNASCAIPDGFIRLHNDSAKGEVSESAR